MRIHNKTDRQEVFEVQKFRYQKHTCIHMRSFCQSRIYPELPLKSTFPSGFLIIFPICCPLFDKEIFVQENTRDFEILLFLVQRIVGIKYTLKYTIDNFTFVSKDLFVSYRIFLVKKYFFFRTNFFALKNLSFLNKFE